MNSARILFQSSKFAIERQLPARGVRGGRRRDHQLRLHGQSSEVHSTVSITGSWHGHLVYASSQYAAKKAAAAFLAMEPDEVSQEDISDVLGELANIVGGNVKAMLPTGCFLSLPTVVLAPDTASYYPAAERISGLYGSWEGEPVSISVWQSVKQEASA